MTINGFLVKPKSASSIADYLELLINEEGLRKKIGENAKKTVLSKFKWGNISTLYYDTFNRIVNS